MNELPWYALKVRTRSETLAKASLDYYGFETFCPQSDTTRQYSDRTKRVSEPVFPGYLFCRFDLANKAKVLGSTAVEKVVAFGSYPIPVTAAEIAAVRSMVEQGGAAAPLPKEGDRVRVTKGVLSGVEGVLVREGNATRFVVSVEILQKAVSVSLDKGCVEAV